MPKVHHVKIYAILNSNLLPLVLQAQAVVSTNLRPDSSNAAVDKEGPVPAVSKSGAAMDKEGPMAAVFKKLAEPTRYLLTHPRTTAAEKKCFLVLQEQRPSAAAGTQ